MPNRIDPNKVTWEDEPIDPNKVQWYGTQAQQPSVIDKITSMRREAGLGPTAVETIGKAIPNIPHSAGEFAGNLLYPFTDYVGFQESLGTMASNPQARQAVVDMYKQRVMNPAETFQKDPVGAAADVSGLFGLAGLGSRLPGAAGRVAGGLGAVGRAVDPIGMAGRAVGGAVSSFGNKIVAPAVGTLAGYTSESVRTAFKGGQVFRDWMRGSQDATDILNSVKGSIDTLADQRRTEYTSRLQGISQITKNADIAPVKQTLDSQLQKFGIVADPQTGKLDFSRSKMDKRFEKDIVGIKEIVDDWGSKPDDLKPAGMDTLKQRLDDYFTEIPGGQQRVDAFLKPIKDKVISETSRVAPEYQQMLSEYAKSTELQKTIHRAFSTRDPASADAAVTKITQALKDNKEFRTKLIETMDSQTGSNLKEMLAGYNLRGYLPQSWLGRSTDIGTLLGVGAGAISPKFLAVLTVSSPRLVGEFANILGRAYSLGSKTRSLLPVGSVSNPAFQSGRAVQTTGNIGPQFTEQEYR